MRVPGFFTQTPRGDEVTMDSDFRRRGPNMAGGTVDLKIRVTAATAQELQALAHEQERSLSDAARLVLRAGLAALKAPQTPQQPTLTR